MNSISCRPPSVSAVNNLAARGARHGSFRSWSRTRGILPLAEVLYLRRPYLQVRKSVVDEIARLRRPTCGGWENRYQQPADDWTIAGISPPIGLQSGASTPALLHCNAKDDLLISESKFRCPPNSI